jgi:hypothetical protein
MKNYTYFRLFLFIFIVSIFAVSSFAQMTSTDTLEKGSVYTEVNLWTGVQSHRNGGQQIYGGRFSYGLKTM